MIKESLVYAFKKSTMYRANMISWFLADLALYISTFLCYFILGKSVSNFGGYSANEILLYISCFFLVNNIYAIFFSESVSKYGGSIINGLLDYELLKPKSLVVNFIIKNINFAPALSTPLLMILNYYCLKLCNANISIIYILSIICGSLTMGIMFFIVYSIALFGIRAEAISNIVVQLLTIGEKPDSVFPKAIQNLLLYVIPVFLFSALPTRIALCKIDSLNLLWIFLAPVIYIFILKVIMSLGLKKYQSGVE
ncbi:ABC-2 family transporter protein [Sedimentibacter sp. zth1]|uniref:ABC-2 family transporter protein n=1 Tax=Sedimentibacter sp. zth1 TaxID=2816908 RepID=UPI001A921C1F|nr:ABC-2 family transporter protein [Sedimentibacter sp. zth1]QSX06473.1 ABC-2 family transporter protein [Sedimentibacter sp. zth1]